ncbi:DUF5990 family protein [Streptomyces sp. NPDC059917]|uniref:DUF5990 family protein n=1 Tax=Streptomyces sp. NPDC059917 TaxID=3347002 RepID=UPI0036655965
MLIRIDATDLPGRDLAAGPGFPGHDGVHVAVQRRGRADDPLDPQPGDAPSATWVLECTATPTGSGAVDITGPYVQGRPAERFVYLTWGTVDAAGGFTMFRRAKLMLGDVPPDTVGAALASGVLRARLGLTDGKGLPLCARVSPPLVEWSA